MTDVSEMKVVVYGSKGWIGGQFINILTEKDITFAEGKARVENVEDVRAELQKERATHVISFIGRTHGKIDDKEYPTIDYLEQKGKLTENVRDNLCAPITLAKICQESKIHYTYLGTGCIFTYDEEHPEGDEKKGFSESSSPNFFASGYSTIKGFTDKMMGLFEDTTLNLRIRMPITSSKNPRNFITKITNYAKICSLPNSMSVLDELLPEIISLMERKITGTLNFTNPGVITHNEVLEMYKELVDENFSWENFTQTEQDEILAAGRSNNCLDTSKLVSLCPEIKNIKDAVRKALQTMGETKDEVGELMSETIKPGVGVKGLLDGTTQTQNEKSNSENDPETPETDS